MREAQLGLAVGKRGIGKTYTTIEMINQYVAGFGGKSRPRRALIMDVNDEFTSVRALKLSDVALFSMHPKIEIRRIRPFLTDGTKMNISDVCEALFYILQNYRGGLLLIEDINKYLSHHFPKDVVGAIVTNRHHDLDIVMHYQAIGKVPTTVWENANWIRFHKNNQSVDRHQKKFEDKYEMLKIAECLVDFQYENGNERFYAFCDIDNGRIRGNFNKDMARRSVEDYIMTNYYKVAAPEIRRVDMEGQKVHATIGEACNFVRRKLFNKYYGKE